jgi:hypothetical protein
LSHIMSYITVLAGLALLAVAAHSLPSREDKWVEKASSNANVFGIEPNSFLAPTKTAGKVAALIWIQGADTPASAYKPLLQAIQAASDLQLWIGMPSFLGNTPEPARLPANIDDTLALMSKAGLPASAPRYFGAHSLGTVFLQKWCTSNPKVCAGQILTGGWLARTNYYPKFSYTKPTLTMGGSLDGLARATRTIGESYYQQITVANKAVEFPVVVIEGMNHYSWGSGPIPAAEQVRDLRATLPLKECHAQAAAVAADFLARLAGLSSGDHVAAAVARTGTWAAPIIEAYNLEGSRHFDSPAQIGGPGEALCHQGGCPNRSAWAPVAQAVMATDLAGWRFKASNEFVDCSSTPLTGAVFHLPNISSDHATKTVATTTYSQCSWALGDKLDTGFVYTSASEIASKLASRQCLLVKGAGVPVADAPFNVTDAPDFCKMANQKAYAWALEKAGRTSGELYRRYGQVYTFGADEQKAGVPLFLDAGITYKDNGDAGVEILSPAMKTSIDYWATTFHGVPRPSFLPSPDCSHYCKLLSPARAMEWIYVDGLRRNFGIGSTKLPGTYDLLTVN